MMKRIIMFILILLAIIVLGDWINKFSANDNMMSVEGYILNKEGILYLINDEDFDFEEAEKQSSKEIIEDYGRVYKLDEIPFSFSQYKNGQKLKVWYSEILESHPAIIKVIKVEK
jgi:hypothetical protein